MSHPENVTVPPADAAIVLPVGAAISIPWWVPLALPPNLEVIVPDTGFTNPIPKTCADGAELFTILAPPYVE